MKEHVAVVAGCKRKRNHLGMTGPRQAGRPRFRGRSRLVEHAAPLERAAATRRADGAREPGRERLTRAAPAAAAWQELEERASTHHVSIGAPGGVGSGRRRAGCGVGRRQI